MKYQIALVAALLMSSSVCAETGSLKTFKAGDRVKAAEINGNFDAIDLSPPQISISDFAYNEQEASFITDIAVSDDVEIFRVKFTLGDARTPLEFRASLDKNIATEYDYYFIREYWPAPGTKTLTIPNLFYYEGPEETIVQIVAQDSSGNLSRSIKTLPAWPGGMFSPGKYNLDNALSINSADALAACGANSGRIPIGEVTTSSINLMHGRNSSLVGGPASSSPPASTAVTSSDTATSNATTKPIGYTVFLNESLGGNTGYATPTDTEVEIDSVSRSFGTVNGISASYFSSTGIKLTYLSENTINVTRFFRCGPCLSECSSTENSSAYEFEEESTAVLE